MSPYSILPQVDAIAASTSGLITTTTPVTIKLPSFSGAQSPHPMTIGILISLGFLVIGILIGLGINFVLNKKS